MPPYIVLKACKKVKDYSISFNVTEELKKFKSEITNQQEILKSSLNMTTELVKYKSEIESHKTTMKEELAKYQAEIQNLTGISD